MCYRTLSKSLNLLVASSLKYRQKYLPKDCVLSRLFPGDQDPRFISLFYSQICNKVESACSLLNAHIPWKWIILQLCVKMSNRGEPNRAQDELQLNSANTRSTCHQKSTMSSVLDLSLQGEMQKSFVKTKFLSSITSHLLKTV